MFLLQAPFFVHIWMTRVHFFREIRNERFSLTIPCCLLPFVLHKQCIWCSSTSLSPSRERNAHRILSWNESVTHDKWNGKQNQRFYYYFIIPCIETLCIPYFLFCLLDLRLRGAFLGPNAQNTYTRNCTSETRLKRIETSRYSLVLLNQMNILKMY